MTLHHKPCDGNFLFEIELITLSEFNQLTQAQRAVSDEVIESLELYHAKVSATIKNGNIYAPTLHSKTLIKVPLFLIHSIKRVPINAHL